MSDKFYSLPIERLIQWLQTEEKNGKFFGLYRENLFAPPENNPFQISRYDKVLETPLGVAAGPHTQMAQNIIVSWLVGARYIELKTVQTLDELEVTKPCIDMEDEGYNCEWSQELKMQNSYDEYLNAWIIIHLLRNKFGWDQIDSGEIFNLSIGYNLEGILKPNVQWFLEKMSNCSKEKEEKLEIISKYYPDIYKVNIPDKISDNITLSTMHGCPSDEIEKIGKYLIEEKKLHTSIKLNPTLLGPERLRFILNDKLGYEIIVPDEAFEHDLKFEEAVDMVKSLRKTAEINGVEFGLKLTNTLESVNSTNWLPENEKMVYTSGRALHPISINLAEKLQSYFKGDLDISFSAGVDAFNISDTLACNLKPVTVCSDLLKPGGYLRMIQYFDIIKKNLQAVGAEDIDQLIKIVAGKDDIISAGISNLRRYSVKVIEQQRYHKAFFPYDNIKTRRDLKVYDCIHAPCIEECAVSQDVPEYMFHTANGNFDEAYKVILRDNPLPNITGNVCDHLCQTKCTKINYDNPLLIRAIKRFNAEKFKGKLSLLNKQNNGIKVTILGAGPSGLSCAFFLAIEGFDVDLFESKSFAGGMVSDSIPRFRLSDDQIKADIEIIENLGVNFYFDTPVTEEIFNKIRTDSEYIYIGIGAQKSKSLNIKGENSTNVYDQLNFLSIVRRNKEIELGKNIGVIGGGNSAVDAARTAKRIGGIGSRVTVIYRRTVSEMPADPEEIQSLLDEQVNIIELAAPFEIIENNGGLDLLCMKMQLGELDDSGRRSPTPIPNSEFMMNFDSIITAIGQDTVLDFLEDNKLELREENETQYRNIFAGGDATRGADSLINAIADGKHAAETIMKRAGIKSPSSSQNNLMKLSDADFQKKQAHRKYGRQMPEIDIEERDDFKLVHPVLSTEAAIEEADRCLYCNDICNICIGVCPNFANIAFESEIIDIPIYTIKRNDNESIQISDNISITQTNQILNIGDFCNECGNCNTFCPTNGAPYLTKPKFYLTEESFNSEDDCYYLNKNEIKYKKSGNIEKLSLVKNVYIYSNDIMKILIDKKNLKIINIEYLTDDHLSIKLEKAGEMIFLLQSLNNKSIFNFQ